MSQAHQCPLTAYLGNAPQQKLPEPARLFDLSEDWLHDCLARRVHRLARFGLQLAPHAIHARGVLRERSFRAGLLVLVMPQSFGGDKSFDAALRTLFAFQRFQVLLRSVPAIGEDFFRPLPALLFNDRYHRRQLLFVVRRLRDCLPNNQLQPRLYRRLRVVALHDPVRASHDARLRIGKVVLILGLRFGFLRVLTLGLRLGPPTLPPHPLGFPDLTQAILTPLQFLRQFVAALVLAVAGIFRSVGGFGFQQKLFHFRLERLLLLHHPVVAHRLVLAGVGFHLGSIQRPPPHLLLPRFQCDL